MFDSDEDMLGLDISTEMRKAMDLLGKAADSVAEDTLPLRKLEASCALRCFEKVRDVWRMSADEKKFVMECVDKCEAPMISVGDLFDDERNSMLKSTSNCLERCKEDDESCANRCISSTLTENRLNEMVTRVRSKILAYKYS
jgi:hypothetical protein